VREEKAVCTSAFIKVDHSRKYIQTVIMPSTRRRFAVELFSARIT